MQHASAQTNTFPSTGASGIGTTTPAASSLLEINSTSKGVLLPRMSKPQRDNIVNPSTGLIIYQTNNTPGFYYYDGSTWTAVSAKGVNKTLSNLVGTTAVNVDLLPDNGNVNLGSAVKSWRNIYADSALFLKGQRFLSAGSGTGNTAVGVTSLNANTSGFNNVLLAPAHYTPTQPDI